MTLKTVLNKVILEPVEAETVTKGGIIIPDRTSEFLVARHNQIFSSSLWLA